MEKIERKGEKTTEAIRIAKGLNEAITIFLKSPKAKLLGYRFKSDVVNDAVRNLLKLYGFPNNYEIENEKEKP